MSKETKLSKAKALHLLRTAQPLTADVCEACERALSKKTKAA